MKTYSNKINTLFILLIVFLAGCDTQEANQNTTCIAVTYLRGICGQAVLKIQQPAHYGFGENADGDEHVFLATLECGTDEAALQGKVFFVQLDATDFNSNCAVCLAAVAYSGSKKYTVKIQNDCSGG